MTTSPIFSHQLGFVKYSNLDQLNQQHLKNMFTRLCRKTGEKKETIHKNSLLTLLGSVGLIPKPRSSSSRRSSTIHQQSQNNNNSDSNVLVLDDGGENPSSDFNDHIFLDYNQVIQKYDDAIDYCGPAMAESMEFFAMLDDDGDGVVDVGILKSALCGTPDEQRSQQQQNKLNSKNTNSSNQNPQQNFITEAEFYFALDAAKLLTGPDVSMTNFDEATGSRLAQLKVDDDLNDENDGAEEGEERYIPPRTSENAASTGTVVAGGLTVYQFLNVILKFAL